VNEVVTSSKRRGLFAWGAWVEASRPRMLTLGLSSGLVPGAIAYVNGVFDGWIMLLETALCTVLLVVSCWADEYGDLEKGVDNDHRLGPIRPLQRGAISTGDMLRACIAGSALAFAIGCALVLYSYWKTPTGWFGALTFVAMGLVAIAATFGYTMGKRPYGYNGLGDVSAYFFFGIVAGLGGYYLYAHTIDWMVLLPMSSVGLLFVSTINLQNLRDFENDRNFGKHTTAVKLGHSNAIIYQYGLVAAAIVCYLLFPILHGMTNPLNYLFVVTLVPLATHLVEFRSATGSSVSPRVLDTLMWPLTRRMGIAALVFSACVCL